ncbi:class F sortase [Streptomyces sp. NPDC086783]|uniref:class F sortase n=1 Tax=Streptomyces sp. NPDC086783 TaxID=3365758 RepID=UPI00380E1BDF
MVAAAAGLGVAAAAAGWTLLTGPLLSQDAGRVPPTAAPHVANAGARIPSPPREVQGPGDFRATVVPVAASADGEVILPKDAQRGGWWALGSPAGASQGTMLIAGHVDTPAGLGAFAAIHDLRLGARLTVTAADGHTYPYVVAARRTYLQRNLPRDLFTRQGAPRLALLTCGGTYEREAGGYDSNLVVYATPAPD